jgi:hypothetical protein
VLRFTGGFDFSSLGLTFLIVERLTDAVPVIHHGAIHHEAVLAIHYGAIPIFQQLTSND